MRIILFTFVLGWLGGCTGGPVTGTDATRSQFSTIRVAHAVHFDTDSAEIDEIERRKLIAFLDSWRERQIGKIRIEGHADQRASDDYNIRLSERRLISTNEIVSETLLHIPDLQTTPYGERSPIDRSNDEGAWRANRRVNVELWLVSGNDSRCSFIGPSNDDLNQQLANLGCATEANRTNSMAYPVGDALNRKLGTADPTYVGNTVKRYRTSSGTGQTTEATE